MRTAEFCNARAEDARELTDLWLEAFGAEEERFARRFFQTLFAGENCFTARENGRILSAAHAIPYDAFLGGEKHRVAYLYAVATRKSRRGEGIFAALHRYIRETLTRRGVELLFLIPENDSLFDFWQKKMGYRTLFYRSGFYTPALPESFVSIDPDPKLLYHIYLSSKNNESGFRIVEDYMSFCLTLEDKHIAVDISGKEAAGYVIYTPRGEGFIIHDYPAVGRKKLWGAGRTVPSAPAIPLCGDLFFRLYKTKPRLNFLLN